MEPCASSRLDGVPVKARVWLTPNGEGMGTNTDAHKFPEVFENDLGLFERTADVGLALAGGGIRASCESLGLLQALEQRGLLQHVRYVSSISGSSWLNAPFSFLPEHTHPVESFLAPKPCARQDLKTLTMNELKQLPEGSFLKACADARVLFNKGCLGPFWGDCLCDDLTCCCCPRLRAWSQETSVSYLKPFGLLQEGSVMSPPVGTVAFERARQVVQRTRAKVLPMRRNAPYPIIIANCQIGQELLPLEFTPLYSGVPAAPAEDSSEKVGGGVVESFGIGSPAPASLSNGRTAIKNCEEVTVTPDKFVSLSFAAGASGAAVTLAMERAHAPAVIDEALGASHMQIWSPLDIHSEKNGPGIVADGGGGGDIAVLGLLRRGVKRIIVQLTPTHPLPEVDIDDHDAYQKTKATYFSQESYLPYLFGLDGKLQPNSDKQVFMPDALDSFFAAAVARKKNNMNNFIL
jgi:hypothetical protein